MANDSNTTTSAKPEPKTDRKAVATTTWFNAEGSEAESPLDNVALVTFKLDSLGDEHKGWSWDYSQARDAMTSAGLPAEYINSVIAFSGFGFKTKLTNEASGIRNNPKLDDAEKTPEAQAAALEEFFTEVNAGNWRAARGEGENVPGVTDLAQAVFNFQVSKGKKDANLDTILANVKKLDKDGRKKFRDNPDIKVALKEIQLERMKAKAPKTAEGAASADDLMNA